jgi:hypothetical protein
MATGADVPLAQEGELPRFLAQLARQGNQLPLNVVDCGHRTTSLS